MNFKKMLPKDKGDIDSIIKLTSYSFEELEPIKTNLLSYLQDMNWPIAPLVADYLIPHINELTTEIIEVFKSNDDMWKYWLIAALIKRADYKIDPILIADLIRMRDSPSWGETDSETNQVFKQALEHLRNYI